MSDNGEEEKKEGRGRETKEKTRQLVCTIFFLFSIMYITCKGTTTIEVPLIRLIYNVFLLVVGPKLYNNLAASAPSCGAAA